MNAQLRSDMPPSVLALPLAHADYYGLRAGTPAIVAVSGRLRTGPASQPGEVMLQRLVAALVGCASARHDGCEIAELLEGRGASYAVEADADGLRFSARACASDLEPVLAWTLACLREPEFDQALLDAERARMIAELQYRAIDPGHAAASALTRSLYPPAHPAYEPGTDEQIAQLERYGIADVRRCHRERYGANELRIAVVGDVDPHEAARLVERELAPWTPCALPAEEDRVTPDATAQRVRMRLPEQESYGVAMGQRLAVGRAHPDHTALQLANRILGGAYASRLVARVREQRGLSYAIRSTLVDAPRGSGHWQVALSASPDKLDDAVAVTRETIAELAASGVQAPEFESARRAAIGAYQIGLATLDGLSAAILAEAERGESPGDLRGYERRMAALTLEQLNRAIGEGLQPQRWSTCIAGPYEDG
ncbi:insulinase family protein [Lysobacter sp. 5GHs7-4]|uniref:M16 family metallopeptidase n=1 Tax=Lysobacter sp. 5GHs7-4 TaxID=2904253 RepID=UPI001E4BE70B|nr:pitrilysin family protein [Lysobacter sp. 5GHs7-4]UHQ22962.1 insulinase family protein [Lysobacter sp. 5GHs7-4]